MSKFLQALLLGSLIALSASPSANAADEEPTPGLNEATFKGLEWRGIGPALMSGRIADIAIDPGYYGPRVRIIEVDVSNPDSPSASNELLLDGKADRSFAYPCSNSVVGRHGVLRRSIRNTRLERTRLATWLDAFPGPGDTRSSYRSAAENLFTACRGGGLTLCDEIPATDRMDRFMLPSVSIENDPLENIQHFVNRGWSGSKWPILQFHGVGGDHGQNCDPKVFEKFVHWLASEGACVMTITNAASEVLPPAE